MRYPIVSVFTLLLVALPNTRSADLTHQTTAAATAVASDLCTKPFPGLSNCYEIEQAAGDATLTIVTNDQLSLADINLTSLNEILIEVNSTIGIRLIHVIELSSLRDLILNEVQYLQECACHPIAILVIDELWTYVADMADDIDYNIWKLPPASTVLFPKIVHVLYELQWKEVVHSIDIRAADIEVESNFIEAARHEQLCLVHAHDGKNADINVAIGNEIQNVRDLSNETTTTTTTGVTIAVPIYKDDFIHIRSLPTGSYIFMDMDPTYNSSRISSILIITSVLSHLSQLMLQSLGNCAIDSNHHQSKYDVCKHPDNWNLEHIKSMSAADIFDGLNWSTLTKDPNLDLLKIIDRPVANESNHLMEFKKIATINMLTNVTTVYHYRDEMNGVGGKLGQLFVCDNNNLTKETMINIYNIYNEAEFSREMYWRIKPEVWVSIGLTLAVLGVLISFAIFVFILVRLYMEDVLEGNPVGTIALLIALIMLFSSFIPFSVEYTSDRHIIEPSVKRESPMVLCSVRLVLVTLCYCFTFSLILCRAVMLASIGSEGGFLSHINGYIQSVICVFSLLVQLGMSTQLMIVMYVAQDSISCDQIYYGDWFWVLLGYDMFLLVSMFALTPFIVRSQRNYREGVLLMMGTLLCIAVWGTWIPLATFGREWRDAAIPLGVQATGWAILGGILVPRSFLIVRGIARADLAHALPSLASLAFAHNTQYMSEQSIYECVNPAMRQSAGNSHQQRVSGAALMDDIDNYMDRCHSPSEIPTLPLRGNSRKTRNMVEYAGSQQSTLPASPNKATRF